MARVSRQRSQIPIHAGLQPSPTEHVANEAKANAQQPRDRNPIDGPTGIHDPRRAAAEASDQKCVREWLAGRMHTRYDHAHVVKAEHESRYATTPDRSLDDVKVN
jgi:hypothetical protein